MFKRKKRVILVDASKFDVNKAQELSSKLGLLVIRISDADVDLRIIEV